MNEMENPIDPLTEWIQIVIILRIMNKIPNSYYSYVYHRTRYVSLKTRNKL